MRSLRVFLLALVPASLALAQTITSSSPLPSGSVNQFYQTTLTCTGCNGFPWSVSSGALPPPLQLNSTTGVINGTPTTAGVYNFTIELNTFNIPQFKNFQITISGPLTVTSTSFPNGAVNTPYSQMLTAIGGVPPYSWNVSGLPQGLALQQSNGNTYIVGTPTAVGSFGFTLTVFDNFENTASVQTSITINSVGGGPAITTTTVPNGVLNQPYSTQLACVNCLGYVWALANGSSLPPGLAVSPAGVIAGTPTALGTFNFAVSVSASDPSFQSSATANLSITINATGLAINESSIPVASQNTPYTTTLTGSGGTPPYTWLLQSTANDGLSINKTTGVISGTPTATGLFTLVVIITDSTGVTATKNFTLNVVVQLSILTTSLPNGTVGNVYPTQTLSAGGGQPPYRWAISTGTLPPGLTLDGVFGRISGTPTNTGFYAFTLVVTDNQANTANASLSISVGNGITITPATLPAGAVGVAYSQTLTATGGQPPIVWSIVAGSQPTGLTLDPTSGILAGTPTASGTFTFNVQATDSAKAFGQLRYVLVIAPGPLTITTPSLPDATVGVAYSQTVSAVGGTPPYAWAISAGALPTGLTINATTGVISGTPTAVSASSFTVQVTDAAKGTATQAYSIATAVALTATPTTLPAAVVGVAYTQKFTASGGKGPYTFALTGTLPAGFTFTAATATISGTAPAVESGSFTITVTDAAARTLSLPLTLTAAAPPITLTPTTLTAIVGVPFTQVLTPGGGVKPYTFSSGLGSPPAGFTFNTATGTITGTAAVAESGVINVVVTDSAGTAQTFAIALTVNNPPAPTVTVTGVPATSGFSQQLPVTVSIGTAYPVNITGTVSLKFVPSVTPATGVDDAMIQFSSGSRVINFNIPAGSTTPTLTNASSITILTGTTAGTITVTTSLTTANGVSVSPDTIKTIVNASGVPFISSVAFQQTPGGVTVTVVGFSSTREMVSGLFHFAPATGKTFTSSDITVSLAAPFTTWWSNTAQSNPFGTQFTLTVPFTLSTQSTSVVSVTVTLTNSKGASNAVTLSQ